MYIKTSHQDGNPCLYVGILLLAAAVMAALVAENPAASPERDVGFFCQPMNFADDGGVDVVDADDGGEATRR